MSHQQQIKLAEALLRRKELQERMKVLSVIKDKDLFEVKAKRISVTDSVDDLVAQVPKLTVSQLMEEYNYTARQLREIDAAIQRANWETTIIVNPGNMVDFAERPTTKANAEE